MPSPKVRVSDDDDEYDVLSEKDSSAGGGGDLGLIESFAGGDSRKRAVKAVSAPAAANEAGLLSKEKQKLVKKLRREQEQSPELDDYDDARDMVDAESTLNRTARPVEDFNRRLTEQQRKSLKTTTTKEPLSRNDVVELSPMGNESETGPSSGIVQSAFDRMRPSRIAPEVATITIGSKSTTSVLGPSSSFTQPKLDLTPSSPTTPTCLADDPARQRFSSSMRAFAAPGSNLVKSVGRPQSKARTSRRYSVSLGDNEEKLLKTETSPVTSTPSAEKSESSVESPGLHADQFQGTVCAGSESDDDYLDDDDDKKAREEALVAELIEQAEEKAAMPSQDNIRRADQILKGRGQKTCTTHLIQMIDQSAERINQQVKALEMALKVSADYGFSQNSTAFIEDTSVEERLSLTVSKADFADMHIIGQFNLGFILAVRAPSPSSPDPDLFIIDQHASDEKYNFERLQTNTIVQNQRLVHPYRLDLTAIEEEIALDNSETLLKNGFQVEMDISSSAEVGRRCKLISLPMSREVTFDITDLEELIALLAESPSSSSSENVPRPTKVRRMLAMRACRSSVMIGKTLTLKQMGALVRKMGEIDKPWNCPHGRPTMRHLCGLREWEGWKEDGGIVGLEEERDKIEWGTWIQSVREQDEEMGQDEYGGKEKHVDNSLDSSVAEAAEEDHRT